MLKAKTLAEALLYIKTLLCPDCKGALQHASGTQPAENQTKSTTLAAKCDKCGLTQLLDFSISFTNGQTDSSRAALINPTDQPSHIIDVGQWIVLAHLFIELSQERRSAQDSRMELIRAALCFDEALKFYDDPESDLPPRTAFFCEASMRRFRDAPQQFSRTRLMGEKARLPNPRPSG